MLRSRFLFCMLLCSVGALPLAAQSSAPALAASHRPRRHFRFRYAVVISNPHPGAQLRIWIPAAHSDRSQRVRVISATGSLPLRLYRQPEYGNRVWYAQTRRAPAGKLRFNFVYDVLRYRDDRLIGRAAPAARIQATALPLSVRPYLLPNRLVPVNGLPARLARAATAGQTTPLAKAHALYAYVLHHMTYSKTGTGWGHGNALYACTAHHGNCTDFHSLFMAMARSQGIPVRFYIGFPLPSHQDGGLIGGYHCWVNFYIHGLGWLPADISEAWLHPRNARFFFGNLDANRVRFTAGRDLVLRPRQQGPPLNYFVYPYVERNGRPDAQVSDRFHFHDLAAPRTASLARRKLSR